mgnify:CR=1 FL=1
MKISSRLDYAISCIIRVANKYKSKKPVSISYVSEKEKLEYDYAEQLLVLMKKAGLLKSIRGPVGGYILARPPEKITVKDVAIAIEGKILELICFRKKGRRKKCVHLGDCRVRNLWLKLGKEIESFLARYTIKGLLFLRKREKSW